MRHVKFLLLNIVYLVVAMIAFYMYSGIARVGAEQSEDYFVHFYGVEAQRDARGAFVRNFRWAAEDGALYLIRQPNDNGFNIMEVTATTVVNNQLVDIKIDEKRVMRVALQPQVFRTYATLVQLDWQPLTLWNMVHLKNNETVVVDNRTISLVVSEVVFTPLNSTKYPNGVVTIYLVLVVLLGTWVYCHFSTRVVSAVYVVFGIVLAGMWWYGIPTVVFLGLTNMPLVWFMIGLAINLLLWYYLQRYVGVLQQFLVSTVLGMKQRLMMVGGYVAPIIVGLRWLWQRPILLYSITVALYFGGWLWGTQVLSPIDTKFAVNIPFTFAEIANSRFFSDYVNYQVPELYLTMNEPRSTWISTYNNQTELGREIKHFYGLSPSYVLNWCMQLFITDPFVFLTVAFVLNLYLTGLFALLYIRRLMQHTGLALLAAYFITLSPFFFFWNTYTHYVATTCWGMAILYGLIWLRDTLNWKSVLFLMFAVYSLLSMGYQQLILNAGYMILGYFLFLLWQLRKDNQKCWSFVMYSVASVFIGVSMTAPQYLDILQTSALAAERQRLGIEFFTDVMPYFGSVQRLTQVGFAYILKDILEPVDIFESVTYPFRGGYTSLAVFLLMIIGAIWRWRQTWGWSLWVVIAVMLSFSRTAFAFGYEQLHLPQLSRVAMFFSAGQQIPEMILAVYGVQVIINESITKSTKILFGMVFVGIQLIIGACAMMLVQEMNFAWTFMGGYKFIVFEIIVIVLILVIALVHSLRVKWAILCGIVWLNAIVVLQPLLVTQPIKEIHVTSPAIQTIRQTLQLGERMAMVDNLDQVMPNAGLFLNRTTTFGGNFNVLSQLANIGTYNSLQSQHYVALMKRFGVSYDFRNIYIRAIKLPMPENDQWMANVRTVVSKNPLNYPNLRFVTQTEGHIPFYVYTTPSTMGCCLQVPLSAVRIETAVDHDDYWVDTPKAPTNRKLTQRDYQGDRFVVPVTESNSESIIVFSQIYHPYWYARVRIATGWQDAPTVVVNEAYQGVRVPVGAQEVVMEFRPWVWWSIIPNLFWLGCGLFITVWWLRTYKPLRSWYQHARERLQPN